MSPIISTECFSKLKIDQKVFDESTGECNTVRILDINRRNNDFDEIMERWIHSMEKMREDVNVKVI
jgi:hypothetical protein